MEELINAYEDYIKLIYQNSDQKDLAAGRIRIAENFKRLGVKKRTVPLCVEEIEKVAKLSWYGIKMKEAELDYGKDFNNMLIKGRAQTISMEDLMMSGIPDGAIKVFDKPDGGKTIFISDPKFTK